MRWEKKVKELPKVFREVLEERAVQAQSVTPHLLDQRIEIMRSDILDILRDIQRATSSNFQKPSASTPNETIHSVIQSPINCPLFLFLFRLKIMTRKKKKKKKKTVEKWKQDIEKMISQLLDPKKKKKKKIDSLNFKIGRKHYDSNGWSAWRKKFFLKKLNAKVNAEEMMKEMADSQNNMPNNCEYRRFFRKYV